MILMGEILVPLWALATILMEESTVHKCPKLIKSARVIPYNTPTAELIQVPNFYQVKKMLLERIAIRAS